MKKLIYLGFIVIFFSSCFRGEKEVFLIPEGFEGPVFVMVDESTGLPIKREEKKRIYEIPSDGVLYTQFDNQEKYIDIEYFYVSMNGAKTPIDHIQIQHLSETEKEEILDSKVYWPLVYGGKGDRSFIVGKPKDLKRHLDKLEEMKKEVFKDGTVIMHAKEKE